MGGIQGLAFRQIDGVKGVAHQQTILWILQKCTTPMTNYLFINKVWPEFAELLATRPITIHEFHSTGMDCLNKTFFGFNFNFFNDR